MQYCYTRENSSSLSKFRVSAPLAVAVELVPGLPKDGRPPRWGQGRVWYTRARARARPRPLRATARGRMRRAGGGAHRAARGGGGSRLLSAPKLPSVMSVLRHRGRSSRRRGPRCLARRERRPLRRLQRRGGAEAAGYAFADPAATGRAYWADGSWPLAVQRDLRPGPRR